MKILVLGSGGREHAIAWKLAASRRVRRVFIGPGNAGTENVGTNCPEVNPLIFNTILAACRKNGIDCVFIGPETPLAEGVVDFLSSNGITTIGPGKQAAQLESSKAFSKAFLLRNSLPTAQAVEFSDSSSFERYVHERQGTHLVVKKSGLAAGKGVLDSSNREEILAFGATILKHDRLLVEEFLDGWEVSIFGLSDGRSFIVLPPCTDFKKAHDGDTGPNTGGMGSLCPVPWVDGVLMNRIRAEVIEPTYAALFKEGLGYAGVLYFGLMITSQGPKILEYNVRFGDPETQVLLPMLAQDLGELVEAMGAGTLSRIKCAEYRAGAPDASPSQPGPGAALGVVVASRGYPDHSETGAVVSPIPPQGEKNSLLFHASTARDAEGSLRTGGGRCFTAVGIGADLREASARAYTAAESVRFDGAWYRRDIGLKFMPGAAPRAFAPGAAPRASASGAVPRAFGQGEKQ
ncbi:MAG: phosphoribosylamine--glycine ligase [Spirochaetia bacterium]|jgi:phosphoribosylamine--glycine ligase